MTFPQKQIRAVFDDQTIRVYQAFNPAIADSALAQGTFVSPPFKMARMTWIKPSFLWMMYRCGWAQKDGGQKRVLAVDITRDGFEWALQNSLLGEKYKEIEDKSHWKKLKETTPVRIQWDPERDFDFNALPHRSIQIGLSKQAVERYVNDWVVSISDVTELASQMHHHVQQGDLAAAEQLLPEEKVYPLATDIAKKIELSSF